MITLEDIERIEQSSGQILELCAAARRGVEADVKPCCQEWNTCTQRCSPLAEKWRMEAKRLESALAIETGMTTWQNHAELWKQRAEKAMAELAAIKEERLALAKECVEAWESAVEWSGYASDYFREKHGVYKDQYRLDNARDRLVMLPQAAIKAAQPEYMCPNCVSPWKCNGPHIPEHTIKAAQEGK